MRPALSLAVRSFADSVAAYPGKARSPYGHVSLQTLEPVGSARVAGAVGANIRRLQRDDTLPNLPVLTLFDDIFRPGARTRLLPSLERGVRRTLGIGDNERLDTQLLDNEMRPTTNVCLTPGGVLFMYVPYEIAAYALGEIPVFVPLAELRLLLREGLPVPGAGTGVARQTLRRPGFATGRLPAR